VYGIFIPTVTRARTYLVLILAAGVGWFFEMFFYHMKNLDKLVNAGTPPAEKEEVVKPKE